MLVSQCKLTIDLGAVKANYNYLKSISKARIGAIVKANAYGLGTNEISSALYEEGCEIFFVTQPAEGIELREALKRYNAQLGKPDLSKIYVLNGIFDGEEERALRYDLVPILNTLDQAQTWQRYARKLGKKLPCLVHGDSGINRFGMDEEDLRSVAQMQEFNVLYFMSHLACSEEPSHELNRYQLNKFKAYQSIFPNTQYSLANSSGIFLGHEYHFDLLRPGMALYGLNPTPTKPNPMQNPFALTSRIMQIRDVKEDGFVGYGATCKISKGDRIATIPIGYADGFLRHLSNKGFAYLSGKKIPIVGRISMDLVTLDVTNVDCKVGDYVEIIGPHCSPDEVGKLAGTTGYEILTSLKSRYERIYIDGSQPNK